VQQSAPSRSLHLLGCTEVLGDSRSRGRPSAAFSQEAVHEDGSPDAYTRHAAQMPQHVPFQLYGSAAINSRCCKCDAPISGPTDAAFVAGLFRRGWAHRTCLPPE